MFRDKAFEMILENDLKFPNFPFINLEINLKKLIKSHKIYNLATIKKYIEHLRFLFEYSLNDDSQNRYFKRHLKKHFTMNLIILYCLESKELLLQTQLIKN